MNKLRFIVLIIFVSLWIFDDSNAQINEIKNNRELELITIKTDSINSYNLLQDIRNSFFKKAYLNANFDSIYFDSVLTQAFICKGNQYFWGRVGFIGVTEKELKKASVTTKLIGKKLNFFQFIEIREKLISYFENNAYPFSSVHFNPDSISNNKFYGSFVVEKNKKVIIDTFIVKGNARIQDYYLQNYTGIRLGDEYSEKRIKQIDEKISQIGFVNITRPTGVEFFPGKAKVYSFLKLERANKFNGIIGFLPDENKSGKIIFTGNLNMQLSNSFGKGEKLFFDWKKLELSTQELQVEYTQPYLFKSKTGIDAYFNLYKKDSSYLNVNPKLTINIYGVGENHLKVFYSNQKSSVLSNYKISITNSELLANMSSEIYGLGYLFNNIDYKINPRKGFFIDCEIGVGQRKFNNNKDSLISGLDKSDLTQYELKLNIIRFQQIFKNVVLKIQSQTHALRSGQLFDNELYQIGGLNSLRGIDERSILASEYTVAIFELRYLFEQNSNVFLFYDGGYYKKSTSDFVSDSPYGFGIGTNFNTKAGIFSFNYALSKQFDNPVQIRAAKVHVGYINNF